MIVITIVMTLMTVFASCLLAVHNMNVSKTLAEIERRYDYVEYVSPERVEAVWYEAIYPEFPPGNSIGKHAVYEQYRLALKAYHKAKGKRKGIVTTAQCHNCRQEDDIFPADGYAFLCKYCAELDALSHHLRNHGIIMYKKQVGYVRS